MARRRRENFGFRYLIQGEMRWICLAAGAKFLIYFSEIVDTCLQISKNFDAFSHEIVDAIYNKIFSQNAIYKISSVYKFSVLDFWQTY